jgi:preprotein translocase subunit SecD
MKLLGTSMQRQRVQAGGRDSGTSASIKRCCYAYKGVIHLLKLQPKGATALERLTSERLGKQITIVLGGEVVTMHKIREVSRGGEVQITSCAAGAAKYLLEPLQTRQKNE